MKRSTMFTVSDVQSAAEDFVQAIAEHADTIWEPKDVAELTDSLTVKAFEILRDPAARF